VVEEFLQDRAAVVAVAELSVLLLVVLFLAVVLVSIRLNTIPLGKFILEGQQVPQHR
jgi:hypothetical protein